MSYKRILTVQDISCIGQCSITVALPIISACGIECAVLPSAVLSAHTGFTEYTFHDLADDIPSIVEHFVKEGLKFDAVYTGYLGSTKQITYVMDLFSRVSKHSCVKIVDPAMADNGKLYPNYGMDFIKAMRVLCSEANYILPNLTEACFLTDTEYKTGYDKAYIDSILERLADLGAKNIILTGVGYRVGMTGVAILENGHYSYYEHELLPGSCPGTGDVFASAFTGALLCDKTAFESVKIAADYTVECIRATTEEKGHWYGTKFEPVLEKLITMLNK